MPNDNLPRSDMLRVSLHEQDMQALMQLFPKLTRTEIADCVSRHGPMRKAVETELERLSGFKR